MSIAMVAISTPMCPQLRRPLYLQCTTFHPQHEHTHASISLFSIINTVGPAGSYSRLSPSGQITNAVRSSLRSIFFGPNSFSVKAISKAITNAVRPPFWTIMSFFCGKMASSLSSLRSNEYFQYIVMTILF